VAGPCCARTGEGLDLGRSALHDAAGKRTVSVLTATIFGLASPAPGAANKALVNAAVCTMLGKTLGLRPG